MLLVALKLHLTALEAVFPVGEVSTIPTPAPLMLLDPSTCRIHSHSSLLSPRRRTSCSRAGSKAGGNSARGELGTGFIREVQYPVWLANVVVVKKKNGKWRVCIEFTDLNKACPKDPFPLPPLQENIKDSEGKNRRNFVGISLFRRNSDETRRRK